MTSINVYIGGDLMQGIPEEHLEEHDFTAVFSGAGIGEFVIARDHPAEEFLADPSAWVEVEHRGRRLLTAYVEEADRPFGDPADTSVRYAVRDHWAVLDDTLAYVAPGQPVMPATLAALGQAVATGATTAGTIVNQSGFFAWQGATREAAVRDIVSQNLTRRGYDYQWASPDQGRGGAPTSMPDVRNETLAEAILPVLEVAGLGITVWREGSTFVLDILEPGDYPGYLTLDGPLRPGRATQSRVAMTHVLVASSGDGPARAYREVVDAGRVAQFDRIIEGIRDAPGAPYTWPDSLASAYQVEKHYPNRPASEVPTPAKTAVANYLEQAGRDALAENGPTSTLTVDLDEAGDFKFGTEGGFELGDRLAMTEHLEADIPTGPVFHDRVSSVRIYSPAGGDETVTPVIGAAEKSESARLWSAMSNLATAQRRSITQK